MKKQIYKNNKFLKLLILVAGSISLNLILIENTLSKDQYSIKDLSNLIRTNKCNNCNLEGIDLVNKDLRNAQITNSNLKNSNLSGGLLDNISFNGSNLSGSSLKNASIRNGNFSNTILNGTDFQYSDLTNSLFDFEGLKNSIWNFSIGIKPKHDTFENFYNSGVKYFLSEDYFYAIQLFSLAIEKDPKSIESYLSRAIISFNLEKFDECLYDLKIAKTLMFDSNNNKYQNTIDSLNNMIIEKTKKPNKTVDNILKTIVQSYSLFRFI